MSDDEQKRLERFGRLQPPSFSGAESEDAQDFLDRCHQILRTAGILETSGVSFTTFQLSGVAFRWWEAYERRMPIGEAPLSWHEFSVIVLEKFVPQNHREKLHMQFEQLLQEGMYVTQCETNFLELAHHAVWLVPTEKEMIRSFIDGLTYQLHFVMTRETVPGATFDEVVDIARQLEMVRSQECEEREYKRPRGLGGFSGISLGGQSHHNRGSPYRPAQTARPAHRGASVSHNLIVLARASLHSVHYQCKFSPCLVYSSFYPQFLGLLGVAAPSEEGLFRVRRLVSPQEGLP
ncbi:uncharacterized protein [Nicotiana tomentosiformis]|uniref:uncharacterized protein n=1 Tax=Nicotiana tomentosiformis TaxID=4098 RepID=UPI00388CCC2D